MVIVLIEKQNYLNYIFWRTKNDSIKHVTQRVLGKKTPTKKRGLRHIAHDIE